jgi:hypothetical protein
VTAGEIIAEVAAKHGLTPEALKSKSNVREIAAARNEAMARCRLETPLSYPSIGRLFKKHHTSVIYAVETSLHPSLRRGMDLPRTESPDQTAVRQARLIGAQARQIAELSVQVETLSLQLARAAGQGELFERKIA